jgi:pimeloyl-ACP methyl ester carboxylesterase
VSRERPAGIVCLHGLARGPSDWDRVRAGLEAHGAVATPALPRKPAAALAEARRIVVSGSVVIGHSMGGLLALRIAATARVGAVILTGCAFPVARNGRTRRETARDYAAHRISFLRALRDRPPADGPRIRAPAGLPAVARALARPGRFDDLVGRISAPVLVVHARDDHHVPVDFALAAAGRHPGWEIRVLEAGGHHAHLRAPREWLAAVEPWLADRRAQVANGASPT